MIMPRDVSEVVMPRDLSEVNLPFYILWLLRRGRVSDWDALAGEFECEPRANDPFLYKLVNLMDALEQAGLVVVENWSAGAESRLPSGRVELSTRWPKIQSALDLSLTELTKLTDESMIVRPYFERPKGLDRNWDLFVIMPFSVELQPVYDDHIRKCAQELHLSVGRGDDFFTAHSVMGHIWKTVLGARVVIAECTGKNPNVFYEMGLAHAIGKPVILITQNSEDVPFDIRYLRYIQYDFTPRGMQILEERLIATLRGQLGLGES
jgi:hypothetical protein